METTNLFNAVLFNTVAVDDNTVAVDDNTVAVDDNTVAVDDITVAVDDITVAVDDITVAVDDITSRKYKTVQVQFNLGECGTISEIIKRMRDDIENLQIYSDAEERWKFDINISTMNMYTNKNSGIVEFLVCDPYDFKTLDTVIQRTLNSIRTNIIQTYDMYEYIK